MATTRGGVTKKWERIGTYGGKLVENITQAEVYGYATQVRLEAYGYAAQVRLEAEALQLLVAEQPLRRRHEVPEQAEAVLVGNDDALGMSFYGTGDFVTFTDEAETLYGTYLAGGRVYGPHPRPTWIRYEARLDDRTEGLRSAVVHPDYPPVEPPPTKVETTDGSTLLYVLGMDVVYAPTGEAVPDCFSVDCERGVAWQYVRLADGSWEKEGARLKMRRVDGELLVRWAGTPVCLR